MSVRGSRDYWKPGSWNGICDITGFKRKGEELKKQWNGLRVCREAFEPRNEQDFLRGVRDNAPKPFYRPVAEEIFLPDTPRDPADLIP